MRLKAGMVFVSVLAGLLILEMVCRFVFDPVNYLLPELVDDPVLGRRVRPGSAGHDGWGFRNRQVPEAADIVALGDSMTYGWNSTRQSSFPALLQGITGKSVYNMGMGGYGPLQYFYLLNTKALALNPSCVIAGFYYGNDISDAYDMAYGYEAWRSFRNETRSFETGAQHPQGGVTGNRSPLRSLFRRVRVFLAHNSIVYRIITHSHAGKAVRLLVHAVRPDSQDRVAVRDSAGGVRTVIGLRRYRLRQMSPLQAAEGLRISLEAFARMKQLCDRRNSALWVLLVPTKCRVLADYTDNRAVHEQAERERRADRETKAYLQEHDIAFIDLFPALRSAADSGVYSGSADSHPTGYGNRVIAETVSRALGPRGR